MVLDTNKVSEVYGGQDISSLSDRPNEDGLSSTQLKARFDNLIKNLIPKHNTLIDALVLLLEAGSETNVHTHNMDNIVDGVTNRLFTEVLKLKLDDIEASAEVNQNAFSSIKVGGSTGNAPSKTSTFEIVAGLNVVASIDPLTNKVTLNASGTLATQAVQSLIDDIGNYFTSLEVNGALQEIGASLYPSLSKTTPVDDDTILLSDSASSGVFKKLSWANFKVALKTYFDTIYATITALNLKAPIANPTFTGTQTLPSIVTNGIKFPATQMLSADANTLDDYEEGAFTPTIVGSTVSGLGTYTNQFGSYTKIGNLVHVDLRIAITAHTGTGNILIGGLPFNSKNDANYRVSAYIGFVSSLLLTANNYLTAYMSFNLNKVTLMQYPVGGGTITNVPMDTAFDLMLSITYLTD